MKNPGFQLEELCAQASHEVLLVAPFIKFSTLHRLLNNLDESVKLQCVTRWRPDEIAAGVSDLDVWLLIKDRSNSTLWLRSDLHAKYYRGDQQVLVGSANLTNTALGWFQQSNLELLISSDVLADFEQELFHGSVIVDDTLYAHVKQIVDEFHVTVIPKLEPIEMIQEVLDEYDIPVASLESWLPTLRHPEKLYTAYAGEWDLLGTGSRIAAYRDLLVFELPAGLSKEHFQAYVGFQLLQRHIIREVDKFVETPRRFGAVRDYMKTLACAAQEGFDADIAWQTLMRWLMHFLPIRYTTWVNHHSEIIAKSRRIS